MRASLARCFYCGSRRVYATWGGTVCPVCNGNPRHWRARIHRLLSGAS